MSALGVNEILDRDWVLLNCELADCGTSELYIFSQRIVIKQNIKL